MGAAGPRPLTFDTGALIALERRVGRVYALVLEANRQNRQIHVPATVLAQAWKGPGPRMAPIAQLLKRRNIHVPSLTRPIAQAVGSLCTWRETTDIVDAHVVIIAAATGSLVLTSDPDDMAHLDPSLPIQAV